MDFNKDVEFAKSYRKHKLRVKKWEKEFKSKFGRIPSKYDIKEASSEVRYSYKRYFDLKTTALEESLSQLDDFNSSNLDSFGSFDGFDASLMGSQDLGDESKITQISALPSGEQIHRLLEVAGTASVKRLEKPEILISNSDNECLKKSPQTSSDSVWGKHVSKTNKKEIVTCEAEDINTTLLQRLHSKTVLPRKPRKSLKKTVNNIESLSSTSGCKLTENKISAHIESEMDERKVINKQYGEVSVSMLPSKKPPTTLFKIDKDWIMRCQENVKTTDETKKGFDSSESFYDVENELSVAPEKIEGSSDSAVSGLSSCFGLSNLNVQTVSNASITSEDYVENSESESECAMSKMLKTRVIPVLRKENKCVTDYVTENSKTLSEEFTDDKKVIVKRNKIFKSKRIDRQNSDSTSTRKITRSSNRRKRQPAQEEEQPLNEDDYLDLNSELRFKPRYDIKTSVLKDKNLIDGLASIVEPSGGVKNSKKYIKNALTPEEKLQLKIDSGTLNENFVRINIEKKVYVRGRKHTSYSTFKKQQWKKKKAALGPEFPDGGVVTCFKCGESGHMSRFCRAHKGEKLLPLEAVKETEVLPTLEEAKESSLNQNNECKRQHPIPESFLKLLNEPSTKATEKIKTRNLTISPLYHLNDDGSIIETPDEVYAALKEFGYEEFRPGQERAVMRILSGQSTLVTLSTGSGKSLCYQLPAYLYAKYQNCISLVISPLVSLMEDQVSNMPKSLRAGCLHTNQNPTQKNKIIELIKDGVLDILLISPEAVVSSDRNSGFGGILGQLPPIAFVCIDEVHCVSQWSHNFRPTYLMICRVLKEKLKVNCILGLSATATKMTMKAVVNHIGISDGLEGVITNLPLPDNLQLSISKDIDKDRALIELLLSEKFMKFTSIIVYCIRRDVCEQVAAKLRASISVNTENNVGQSNNKKRKRLSAAAYHSGVSASAYHAGMSPAQRRKVQENFMRGNLKIVVATIAFGMGINKSDVRCVIHYNMPSTFESYVQEVGRAGRDGLPAHCHVFLNTDNSDKNELFRHIYANSVERQAIRKLLQKIFVPCQCSKTNSIMEEIEPEGNPQREIKNRCSGHEVAIAIDECVTELDIPSENIMTLLCYLELHPKKYIQVLNNGYIICKVMSYNGAQYLQKLATTCPPLAIGLAFLSNQDIDIDKQSTVEFNVIEAAASIGWNSGMAKYHLKKLEWETVNGFSKKAPVRVEFKTLGFRITAPGDLSSLELDEALDILFARVQSQEIASVHQLEEISKTLSALSHRYVSDVYVNDADIKTKSDDLKSVIRDYFQRDTPYVNTELEERTINETKAISDIRGLISAYRDCTFTGRSIARILQGISSPNFPALVWGRCPFWRTHLNEDFNKLTLLATQQIIMLK